MEFLTVSSCRWIALLPIVLQRSPHHYSVLPNNGNRSTGEEAVWKRLLQIRVGVQVIGIDTSGNQTVLYTLNSGTQDFDISSVNPQHYPYLTLKLQQPIQPTQLPISLNTGE